MIKNLTPHELKIHGEDGALIATIPPSGTVARVSVVRIRTGSIDGVPTFATEYGEVEGLPEPEAGTVFVVSGLTRAAVPERRDVFQPGELLRDDSGRVIGCIGLSR